MAGFRFPYTSLDGTAATLMPRLGLTLTVGNRNVDVVGLIDSGASVNVLPYSVGVALGMEWDQMRVAVPLTGSLGAVEGRVLVVQASHPHLTANGSRVELVFAWAQSDQVPVLFGQTNFLMTFKVCFDAAQAMFEVYPNQI